MRYDKVAADAFEYVQSNAGVLLDSFTPSTGAVTDNAICGITSGGITFQATVDTIDAADGFDNVPKNTKEFKRQDSRTVTISTTFRTVKPSFAEFLASGDLSGEKITPHADFVEKDYKDLWLVCDYSDKNGATKGGYIAIHLMDVLSTGGFQLKTNDKGTGEFAVVLTAHYSIANGMKVPFEIYMHKGEDET